MQYGKIFPQLLSWITNARREKIEIEWSATSWTHNIFRLYELIFWRRSGIKPEMSTSSWIGEDGNQTTVHACHSWESVFALAESYIRNYLYSWKFVPFRIYVPMLKTNVGFPIFASPYIFAIALDAADNMSSQTQANSMTIAHTCTGSNLILFVESALSSNSNDITGMTYNSAAMSFVETGLQNADSSTVTLYLKTGPSTGANNAVISSSSPHIFRASAASYSGANQSSQPDSHNGTNGTVSGGATVNTSTTVVAANCWLYAITSNDQAEPTAVGTTVRRGTSGGGGWGVFDSNGTVGTGSQSIQWSVVGTGVLYSTAVCSFAPVGGTLWTKTLTESISDSDTLIRSITRPFSESISNSDTISHLWTLTRTFTQSISHSDTFANAVSIIASFSEAITNTLSFDAKLNGSNVIWTQIKKSASAAWSHISKSNQ